MIRILCVLLFFALSCSPALRAQAGPQAGGRELQLWTAGGHAVNGLASDTGLWSVGARYGWVLTAPHGPAFLRGQFEYAVDAVPLNLIFQRTGTSYGVGINPVGLKWNFSPRHNVTPYIEVGGGTLLSNSQVPPGTSRINFTSGGAAGLHFLRNKYNFSTEVRFTHISNAGLASSNPGINVVQVRIGFGLFTPAR